jgi:predicted phosphodiesterase
MNIAVLSCIHGNLEALEAVLRDIDQQSVDQIYSLGDLVGYGPYPNEVVARIRELGIPTCQGCWDEDIVDGLNACDCSYPSLLAETRGRLAHEWTNQAVTPEIRDYLAELPLTLQQDNLCFVHGSPHSQHEYLLPDTSAFIALERVLATGADTLFCGHTHVPYVRNLENSSLTLKVVAPSNQPPIDSPTPFLVPIHPSTLPPLYPLSSASSTRVPSANPATVAPTPPTSSMTLPVKRSPCAKSSTTTPRPAPPLSKKAYPPSLLGDWPKGWNMPKKPMIPLTSVSGRRSKEQGMGSED